MKRVSRFFLSTSFLLGFYATGQEASVDLVYGNMSYQHDFMSQLNTNAYYTFGRPVQYLGIQTSGMFEINRKFRYSGHFLAAKYLPQHFRLNDSLSGTITGSVFAVSGGRDLFRNSHTFDLIASIGMNLGRLKLAGDFTETLKLRKNGFICPKASLMLKMNSKRISFTVNAEYACDVSDPQWKAKGRAKEAATTVAVGMFSQTALSFSAGLGYVFQNRRK